MKRFPSLMLIAGLALACDGDSPAEPGEAFTGTWVWVGSEGGLTGEERTPATEGVTIVLEYDGHTARAYRDGALVDETIYHVETLPTAGPLPTYRVEYEQPLDAFPFESLDEHTIVTLDADTVRFDDPCCDRYQHTMVDAGSVLAERVDAGAASP